MSPLRHGKTVILMYHRVVDDPFDPYFLAVAPGHFAEHISRLRRFAEPVPLAEVLQRAPGPRVAVTLDDGYADNASAALPVLEEAQVPATVFVVSDLIGHQEGFWNYRLERMFRDARPRARHVEVSIGPDRLVLDLGSAAARRRALLAVHYRLRRLPPDVIEPDVERLAVALGEERPQGRPMMTVEDLTRLADSPLITIGAHTRRHPWLAALSAGEQYEEIAGGRRILAELTGEPVDQFAYPFGAVDAFDGTSVRAVRRAGFSLACAAYGDPIVAGTSRFRLPRRAVLDWGAEEFERQLEAWFAQ